MLSGLEQDKTCVWFNSTAGLVRPTIPINPIWPKPGKDWPMFNVSAEGLE